MGKYDMGRISDEELYRELSADIDYPCQYCKAKDRETCGRKECGIWLSWFAKSWKKIRKAVGKE